MKRLALGIALAFLPACIVGNPVAEEQKGPLSAEEQLRANVGPTCDEGCQKTAECGITRDDDPELDCGTSCRQYFDAFIGHGDPCVTLGQSVLDCAAKLETCDDYVNSSDCSVTQEQHDGCESVGSPGPTPIYCDSGGGVVAGVAHSVDGEPAQTTSCDVFFEDCSDGAEYRVNCLAVDGTLVCNCFRDGVVNGVAFTPVNGCPAEEEINAPCGWNLDMPGAV